MSVAALPRIYFHGEMSFDPSLSNNFREVHNPVTGRYRLPPGETTTSLREKLPLSQPRSWNHYGTHIARFEEVKVTGVSLAPGGVVQDILVGKPINLLGRLVDLNPLMDHGTQVFFDGVTIGDAQTNVEAAADRRVYARFLNFSRNLANLFIAGTADATWEAVFPSAVSIGTET